MEPFSLSALGALATTEGIKFLYSQAAEVLKRWRDRKAGKEAAAREPIPVQGGSLLKGTLQPPAIDFDVLGQLGADIMRFASVLGNYANGLDQPTPGDNDLAAAADGLRRALEVVYRQRITFEGENRDVSGPVVISRAEAARVSGDVAGLRARLVRSGRIETSARADDVLEGGKLSGGEFDTVG